MILYQASTTVLERDFPASENAITVAAFDFFGLSIPVTAPTRIDNTWRATLSIPATAPVCTVDSGYYKLVWTHSSGTVEQEFQVVAYDEGLQRPPPAGFGVAGISLVDEVYLPLGATDIFCEILHIAGSVAVDNVHATITTDPIATSTENSPGSVRAVVEFVIGGLSVAEYVVHWRFTVGGRPHHDYRQGFVVSTKLAGMLSSLRMFLDQSQVTRWLSHYQWADVELVDCLYRGASRINAHPPQVTTYSPDDMPDGLAYALRAAALHEMLNRLYLAEGLSTFDFQGGSISVTTDRTQFIQTKMDELNNWLETNLTPVKTVNVTRGSIGHLHLTVSQTGRNNNYRTRAYISPNQFQLLRGNHGGGLIR